MRFSTRQAVFVTAAIVLTTNATAPAAGPSRRFTIPHEPLGAALDAFEAQSGVRTIAGVEIITGKDGNEVIGEFSAQQALETMLAGSGLSADLVGGAYVIHPIASDPASVPGPPSPDQITVTGTRIRGGAPIGSPVVVIDRKAIEDSGRATLPDLLQTIPQNYGGGQTEATAGGNSGRNNASINTGFGTSINLRGLGANSTLTLLDGSRPALSGYNASFSDVSLIPTVAIDRIEILTDGASSIYGSDAVAGVVNLRFRNRFEGFEARVFDGTADGDFGQEQASMIAGKRWSNGGIVVAWQYDHRGNLPATDRDYATQDLTRFGGPDNRSGFALPATLIAADGSTYSATRIGTPGNPLKVSDLVAGAINKNDDVRGSDLLPRQDSQSVYLSADQELGAGASWFAQILWARRRYSEAILSADSTTVVTLDNPYYVDPLGTGQPIYVERDFSNEIGTPHLSGRVTALNATSGVRGTIGPWHYEWTAGIGRQREYADQANFPNLARLAVAAASADPANAFNPFGPDLPAVADVIRGDVKLRSLYTVWTGAARFDGPLFRVPAGAVKLAFGVEYRHDRYHGDELDDQSYATPTDLPSDIARQRRHVAAGYGELVVPVLAAGSFPGRLDVSASGRIERYSDFGSTRNPKIGVRWEPAQGVGLRASWGTSFRAPNLLEKGNPADNPYFGTYLPDPASPTGETAIIDKGGFAPNIGPERSTTWTAGVDLKPAFISGLSLTATYFHTDYRDRIGSAAYDIYSYLERRAVYGTLIEDNPSAAEVAALFADPHFVNLSGITQGEVKAITDGRIENLSGNLIRGIDFDLAYSRHLGDGMIEADVSGTRLLSYKVQITAASTPDELVSTYGSPVRLRVRGSLGWHDPRYDASIALNYTGAYRNILFTPSQPVKSWTTLDLVVGRTVVRAGQSGRVHVGLSVTNLLNEKPPYIANVQVNSTVGYDAQVASAQGRVIALQGSVSW